jgi:hypothetical protein
MQIWLPSGAGRFEKALAQTQGWTTGFAERVTAEYRRFLYLAATAGFEVTPSRTVDEAWHLHLASPHYEEQLCRRILGRALEHRASTGEAGEEERHYRQYEETLTLYETVFGKHPPGDIWPGALSREGRVKTRRHRAARLASRASTAAALAATAAYVLGYPATAPVLGSATLALALTSLLVGSLKARSMGGGASCGGGCASGSERGCTPSCGGGGGCGGGD